MSCHRTENFPLPSFSSTEVLNRYVDNNWNSELISASPTEHQKSLLREGWNYEKIFYDYPNQSFKVGESWDYSNLLGETDMIVTDSSITATLERITEFEGKKAALISLYGSVTTTDPTKNSLAGSESESNDESLFGKASKSAVNSFFEDIIRDYDYPEIISFITEDLYNREFSVNSDLQTSNPELYRKIENVYRKVSRETNFYQYSFSTIEEAVYERAEEENILGFMISSANEVRASKSSYSGIEDNFTEAGDTFDIEVKGSVYRSLGYPINFLVDLEINGDFEESEVHGLFDLKITQRFDLDE